MNTTTVASPKNFASVGAIIPGTYANNLIADFKNQFPHLASKARIKRDTILSSFEGLINVSGIRFMHGLAVANDPESLTILLIPCNSTSLNNSIPNVIISPNGYLDHNGNTVSLKKTWEFLFNHAVHLGKSTPEIRFHKLVRGQFVGIESLHNFLYSWTDSPFINYHLGYDKTATDYYQANKGVLESLDHAGYSNNIFLDFTKPCPPFCGDPDETCVVSRAVKVQPMKINAEGELDLFRSFRDQFFLSNDSFAPLVEMYYYISPSLIEAIGNTGMASTIYSELYNDQVSACKLLLEQKEFDKARILFEQTIDELMARYIFS